MHSWMGVGDGDCDDLLRKSRGRRGALHQVFARAAEETGGASDGRTGRPGQQSFPQSHLD